MKKLLCILLCLSMILLCSCAAKDDVGRTVGEILSLCNAEREKLGAGELAADDSLTASALVRANEICTEGNFSHVRPDGSGCFTAIKGEYLFAGENLAMGENDAAEIVEAWMKSPAHRDNIIKPEFTKTGIAIVKSGETYYIVMLFSG